MSGHLRGWGWTGLSLAILFGCGIPTAAAPAKTSARKHAATSRKSPAKSIAAKKAAVRKTAKAPAPAVSALPAGLTGITVYPSRITLNGPRARQRLVVVASTSDGATHDVTSRATFNLGNPKLARLQDGTLWPLADGETRLTVRVGSHSVPVELTVGNQEAPPTVEFVNDVMPVLARGGCNNTACHGSPAGKGGFKLSLFGYEPDKDFAAITQEADGKRVNPQQPEQSLLLQKATLSVPHAGGQRLVKNSPEYRTLLAWIKDGAPGIGEFEARVRSVRVAPEQPWLAAPGAGQRLVVLADMSDGSVRDVTEQALFFSNDDAIADVNDRGVVTARRAGETAVMVRHLGQVAVSRVAVLPSWKWDAKLQKLADSRPKPVNYVDQLIQAKLRKLRVVPSEPCSDTEFIRRLSLDVLGIIPTAEEVREFVANPDPNKRAKLIDAYLDRPEYVDLWTLKWNDTLRNNPRLTRVGAEPFARWIREQVATNRPYNEWVSELLTARGKSSPLQLDMNNLPPQLQRMGARAERLVNLVNAARPNPAVNYFVISRDPLDATSATSQIFLGVRIECARCHNHPFEKWTQTDYYGLAAFLMGVRVQGNNQIPSIVTTRPRVNGPRHPVTNEVVAPKTLDDRPLEIPEGTDRRVALAQWMTAPENEFFAQALVNRLWGYYFGRGIVDPIDDFRATNPASNPELLAALAKDFVEHGFDIRHMHRVILNSNTYQQSARPHEYNRHDTTNFARYYPKRMMAEQLYDSISQATGIFLNTARNDARNARGRRRAGGQALAQLQGRYGRQPQNDVARVMQLPALVVANRAGGGVGQFLDAFGKPRREAVCECERSDEGNIGQALSLINGNEVNTKISHPLGRVRQVLAEEKSDGELIEELYLAALSRKPAVEEVRDAEALLRAAPSRLEGAQDLMWGLLNSREFLFVH